MHDQVLLACPRKELNVTSLIIRTDADGLGMLVADALLELARLALEGASRVELAACATRWLERMVPGCRAVVVEAAHDSDEATVLTDTEASGQHLHARFSFAQGSAIAQAYLEPLKAFHASGEALAECVSGYAVERARDCVLVCAGIMGKASVRTVLAALIERHKLEKNESVDVALLILASQLAVALSVAKNRAAAAGATSAIGRAKLEWERTVDALADIVCLLDADGRIVRANRVVERWGLGRVSELVGKPIHEAFHAACNRARCALAGAIGKASQELLQGGPTHFEYRDEGLDMDLRFTFRPMLADPTAPASASEIRAVLVVEDVSALSRAREALSKLNAGLETRIRARTQELREANRDLRNEVVRRKAAETALRTSHNERSLLSEQLISAQENERHRIARELHDAVGQSLSAVKYSIEQAVEMLRRPGLGDPLPVLMRAVRGTLDATESTRTIATSLRPTTLDDMGPASAISGFCKQFAEVYRNIEFQIEITATDEDVPDRLATALFRSAQELLNNVVRHAGASRVCLTLRREPLLLQLEVRDDGVGLAASQIADLPGQGHGIRNIRERAEMSGGMFELRPGPDGGTVARLSWPLLHDEASEREAI